MDTSEKYVRGEEGLGAWKARGLTVVEDYLRLDTAQRRAADVNAVKTVLASLPTLNGYRERDPDALAQRVINAWPKGPQQSGHVRILHAIKRTFSNSLFPPGSSQRWTRTCCPYSCKSSPRARQTNRSIQDSASVVSPKYPCRMSVFQ